MKMTNTNLKERITVLLPAEARRAHEPGALGHAGGKILLKVA